MTPNATGSEPPDNLTSQGPGMPKVNKVTAADIAAAKVGHLLSRKWVNLPDNGRNRAPFCLTLVLVEQG